MAEMALTYTEVDGLLYPDLELPEESEQTLLNVGKYGLLAMEYLKENEPQRYKTLTRFGILAEKLHEVDEEANLLMDQLQKAYLMKHQPKDPHSTMEMWKLREQAKMQAEEIVLNRVVNRFR